MLPPLTIHKDKHQRCSTNQPLFLKVTPHVMGALQSIKMSSPSWIFFPFPFLDHFSNTLLSTCYKKPFHYLLHWSVTEIIILHHFLQSLHSFILFSISLLQSANPTYFHTLFLSLPILLFSLLPFLPFLRVSRSFKTHGRGHTQNFHE